MGNAAERIDRPQITPDHSRALERLLANLVNSVREGAGTVTYGTPNAPFWSDLEQAIGALTEVTETPAQLRARQAAIMAAALDHLDRAENRDARRAAYLTMLGELDGRARAWQAGIAADVLAHQLHRTLLWGTAWHLLGAGVPMAEVIRVIEREEPRQPVTAAAGQPWRARFAELPLEETWAKARIMAGGVFSAASSRAAALAQDVANRIATYREAQQRKAAQVRADQEATAEAMRVYERQEAEKVARAAAEHQAAQAAAPKPPDEPSVQTVALNGRALRGSVFGTWLLLVVMSWVSLIWGTLISMPFGIGLGLMMTFGVGIFMVPLWGTLFGFLGMGGARDSTLRQMGFKELPEGHVLRSIATHYCQALDIPVPRLGTIGAHNAFAMGSDRNDATVAIGRPLIESLSPRETAAVLAHELGHVVSGDMRKMMLMRTFQNATVWFGLVQGLKQVARWIICWAAELCILAFSRKREYWADAIGAALAGKDAMIGALQKLEHGPALTSDERTHARFMVRGKPFSTHPSTADRIKALEAETFIRRLPRR